MISPGNFNLNVWTEADFVEPFILYQATTSPINPSTLLPMNLTGFTGTAQIRLTSHQDILYEMTTENGGINIATTTSGSLSLYIPKSVTARFSWPAGVWDLYLTDNNGNYLPTGTTAPFLTGQVTVRGIRP